MENMIVFKNVSFSYDEQTPALKSVSLTVEKGMYTTIIGHNGSGKSTLAKLVIGLLKADQGEILVDGLQVDEAHIYEIRNKIGIVFQNPDNQFIGSSVRDDIAFGLENHCVKQEEMDDIIQIFASKVHMEKFLDSEPTRLSGGQKQRVAIAGVLAMAPEIIILDEATSMLDPMGKEEINALVHEIHEKQNMTIVSITHDMEEVTKSDRVIVMDDGHVCMYGKPEDVLQNEAELIRLQLDIPFAMKLSKQLQEQGLALNMHITIEGLVNELCQLRSRM